MNDTIKWLKTELEKYGDPYQCEIEWSKLDEILEVASMKVTLEKVEMRALYQRINSQLCHPIVPSKK